ncbi:MAG: ubiquinone biosynthesis regulatory protein kinase UbiB [Thiothrix sp.]|nr:ubiquinone biosynthesis regulatory protein kinase UbiB [Thiothrix sp.]HPQ94826.1 ubiquinone biosynthesis regulatory protein kinase UbiB [Thiolinea sp.]
MKVLLRLSRLITIVRVFFRHGLDELLLTIPLMHPLGRLYRLMPWNRGQRNRKPRGERIRLALEDLGPIFIKFGQMLSTRRDLLPDDIALELRLLQDRVPPFPAEEARRLIETAYGRPVTEVFQQFEARPMASASVAQVHAATLWDGSAVVIKVLRPGIEKTIRQDIALMYVLASLLQRYWKEGRRLRPTEVVREYEKNIFDELDMQREAANASQLRRNFANLPDLYIPEVYWDYTRLNVMVMERIYGVPIGNIEELATFGINFKRLGERGVEIFFTQVFRHNFFHADMHPGNIFVDISNPADPRYLAVDFGIVGTLSPADQRYLAENFHAFFNRDYRRVAELHVESGWVPASTRVDEFESAIRSVCEPIFERPISQISFGQLLMRLFQTARRFNMQVQPQLVLLQKTLLNIEGLGRQLYPELDLWTTAKPFIQRWMDEQVGVRALLRGARYNLPKLLENLPYMPNLLHDLLQQANQNQLRLQWESAQLEQLRQSLQRAQQSNRLLLAGGVLLLAALLPGLQAWLPHSGVALFGLLGLILLLTGLLRR